MAYIDTVGKHFNLEDAFKVKTSMDTNVHLTKKPTPDSDEDQEWMGKLPYLSLIRYLMYMSMGTCQDITHAISHLGKYSVNPGNAHWTATQQVLHYLNGA